MGRHVFFATGPWHNAFANLLDSKKQITVVTGDVIEVTGSNFAPSPFFQCQGLSSLDCKVVNCSHVLVTVESSGCGSQALAVNNRPGTVSSNAQIVHKITDIDLMKDLIMFVPSLGFNDIDLSTGLSLGLEKKNVTAPGKLSPPPISPCQVQEALLICIYNNL